jgi:thymidylate synthase
MLSFCGRKTPEEYMEKEIQWYDSMDLSVEEIGKHAKIWMKCACEDRYINSNYGYLIYHPGNFRQYKFCLETLQHTPDSRRAIMIYTRPSIQIEHNIRGMSDFICTIAHQFFIRFGKLISVVEMRSNDCVFGMMNDFAWFATVQERLLKNLQEQKYPELEMGELIYIANSWHLYERHFDMLDTICEGTFFYILFYSIDKHGNRL